jgi:hypothetical protein
VLDQQTVAYPEYRGSGVMSTLGNISENPHVGLMFIDFAGDRVGLHVDGSARIVENEELSRLLKGDASGSGDVTNGNSPQAERWVLVSVCDAFIHCSKHVLSMRKVDLEVQWGTDDPRAKGEITSELPAAKSDLDNSAVTSRTVRGLWSSVRPQYMRICWKTAVCQQMVAIRGQAYGSSSCTYN